MENLRFERELPLRYEADVLIAGGGIAGVSAALAAAKSGVKALLIERFGVPGGNATSGGVGAFCGETRGQGEAFDEIVRELERFNAIEPYQPYERKEARCFDPEILAFVLQELLARHGVEVLLHSRAVDCVRDGATISHCVVAGASGLEAASARLFVDCSGEASLAAAAGFKAFKGRESDGAQLPMSLMFFVRHTQPGDDAPALPDGFVKRLEREEELPMTSVWPNGPRSNAIKIKIPLGDSTDTASLSEAERRARRKMMQVLDFEVRKLGRPWMLERCSPSVGVREGRRVEGEYVLTVDDLRAGRKFDDAIARGVFYLDGHKPDDEKRTYILSGDLHVPPYQIPFRSLIPKGAANLLVAGRCLSADQLALSSARVMTTCSMTGSAAGIGAALAVKTKVCVQELNYGEVRREVSARGAVLG